VVGVTKIIYGLRRERAVREALKSGTFTHPGDQVLTGLTLAGVLLGLLLAIVGVAEL
jgi:hypothetical protein